MTGLETDEEQLSGRSGLVQLPIEFGILCEAIRSKSLCEDIGCLDQMVVHLQEADQNPGIHFPGHKETYEASGPLHFHKPFSNLFAVHLASRIEHLARVIDCYPSLPQSVDCPLAKCLASGLHAMGHPPFLKQRSPQGHGDGQGRSYRADRGPIRRHVFLPQSPSTLAIGATA